MDFYCFFQLCFPVSDSSSQGFDPSEFPVLSLGNRARHDSAGGLITSSAISQRPGYGMYIVFHVVLVDCIHTV